MRFFLLPLFLSCTACAPFEWMPGYWNVTEAMFQCKKELSKVSYPAKCDDSTSDTSMNGYGEVWLVNTQTNNITKIWRIR